MDQLSWSGLHQRFQLLHDSGAQDLSAHWFWSTASSVAGSVERWSLSGADDVAHANFRHLAELAASKLSVAKDGEPMHRWLEFVKEDLGKEKHPDCRITGVSYGAKASRPSDTKPRLRRPTQKGIADKLCSEGGTIYWICGASARLCERLAHQPDKTTDAILGKVDPKIEAGKWADNLIHDATRFVTLVRSGQSPDGLRGQFPVLFVEVLEVLAPGKRDWFLKEAGTRRIYVPELLEILGDVRGWSAATLADHRKAYRNVAELTRKRSKSLQATP
jgi:hypothetical protein